MWKSDHKESWAPKKWCFWIVVLEKTLESCLDCKGIRPLHPKDPSWCSLEGLMLKLKLQFFGHLMQRVDSFEKTSMLGKIEGGRRKGWQRMRWLDGITDSTWVWVSSGSWWWMGKPGVLQSNGSQRVGHDWVTELNWTVAHSCTISRYPTDICFCWTLRLLPLTQVMSSLWLSVCIVSFSPSLKFGIYLT